MTDLRITVGESFPALAAELCDAVRRFEAGEAVAAESSINFENWEVLARTLTPKRLELLRVLHRQPSAGISALARTLGRNYRNVHADVEALSAVGLIERSDTGALHADYDGIQTRIAL